MALPSSFCCVCFSQFRVTLVSATKPKVRSLRHLMFCRFVNIQVFNWCIDKVVFLYTNILSYLLEDCRGLSPSDSP